MDTARNAVSDSQSFSSSQAGRLTNMNVLVPLVSYFIWRIVRHIVNKKYIERWILMFNLGGDTGDLPKYKMLAPPSASFWADPFILRKDDGYYVFIEEMPIKSCRGHISIIRMNESGEFSSSTKIIERPYHLSYPFVLEWRNELYVIPESAENRTIEVYRCKEFPKTWEFDRVLMNDVSAFDTTLLEHNGIWWMFTNIKQHAGASSWDELCLFHSDDPLSAEWRPHPMNPVISDVRYARPEGKIFRENGCLFRPSQNSSHRYGYGLNINQILELTTTNYRERVVKTFEPTWDKSIKALHSYSKVGELAFIDVIYRTRKDKLMLAPA